MMLDKQRKTFHHFYDSARYNEVLDDKTSLMVHLGAASFLRTSKWLKSSYNPYQRTEKRTDLIFGPILSNISITNVIISFYANLKVTCGKQPYSDAHILRQDFRILERIKGFII